MEDQSRQAFVERARRPAAPAATTPTMTAAEQAGWDRWLQASVSNALHRNNKMWRGVIITIIRDLRAEWQREIDLIVEQTKNEEAATRLRQLRRQIRDDLINRKADAVD